MDRKKLKEEFKRKFVQTISGRGEPMTVDGTDEIWNWIETALKAQAKQLNHDHKILVNTILETQKDWRQELDKFKEPKEDEELTDKKGKGYLTQEGHKNLIDLDKLNK